jgi:alpha-tubulin suppressor-like RCC1 family protein
MGLFDMKMSNVFKFTIMMLLTSTLLSCNGEITIKDLFDEDSSELAYSSIFDANIPIETNGPANMSARHSCGVTKTANVMCWGSNALGQLGDGTLVDKIEPTIVLGGTQGNTNLENITSIKLGHSHSCAIDSSENVFCWGDGDSIGEGSLVADSSTPIKVVAGDQASGSGFLENVIDLGLGYSYSCALTRTGSVYCWGTGSRIGGGASTSTSYSPQSVVTGEQGEASGFLEDVRSLGIGMRNACAVTNTDELYCWGDRRGSGIGLGSATLYSPVRTLSGQQGGGAYLSNVKMVSSGWNKSCAAINDGSAYCWGSSGDSFGHDGSDASTPVRILAGTQTVGNDGAYLGNVNEIKGSSLYCAVTNNEDLYCWTTSTPAKVESSEFVSGYIEGVKTLSAPLATVWVSTNSEKPFGFGYGYHSTFPGMSDGYYSTAYFLDITE